MSIAIGKELKLDEITINALNTAALLHDLGKIVIPASILSKPSKLTELEFKMLKEHSKLGYDILKDIDFGYPIAEIILQHHERIDGSGYPYGIKGSDIVLEAKIIAIADTVEAMSSHRPYRLTRGLTKTLKEIEDKKGIFYEASIVDVCIRLFKSGNFKF